MIDFSSRLLSTAILFELFAERCPSSPGAGRERSEGPEPCEAEAKDEMPQVLDGVGRSGSSRNIEDLNWPSKPSWLPGIGVSGWV